MTLHRKLRVLVLSVLLQTCNAAIADAAPQSAEVTEQLLKIVLRADAILAQDAKNVEALQARGEANFRLGRIEQSVRDFDQVVELAPESMPFNWQRGIALYYVGRLEDAVKQFERHRSVNPQDVENATWHFLCLSRLLGPEKGPAEAQKQLIPITSDARIPLMKVHALYAGKASVKDVTDAANAGNPSPQALRTRLFYAHLYIALYHEARGEAAEADKHMALAATTYGVEGYMGDVARVHAWRKKSARRPSATRPANTE